MTRKFWGRISWPIVFAGVSAPFIANCGGLPGVPKVPGVPSTGNCPDMAKVEDISKFDFAGEFKLKADVAAKVKGGVEAAAHMKELADKLDGDLKVACGNLAHDLGAAGDYKDGQEACNAAAKVLADVRAKIGASAKITVDITPPHCGADINAYADCAGHCDASVSGGKAEVKCEPGKLQGECSASCTGECELSAAAACSGECSGTCDAEVKGACDGTCSGKCDGKAIPGSANGKCDGTCEGKCSGNVKAECKGKCGGQCKLKAEASCSGTCTGSCSVEMKAPKCTGKVEAPKVSAECKASCDAGFSAKVTCTPAHVGVRIVAAIDASAEAKLRGALEKDLGPILEVDKGIGEHAKEVAGSVSTVIQGVQASLQTAGGDAINAAKLTACVASPLKGALDSAASVSASVTVSAKVSASASGKAG